MISVSGPSITSRLSLSIQAVKLSGPGDLFNGNDDTTWRTSSHDTGFKLNDSGGLGLEMASVEVQLKHQK